MNANDFKVSDLVTDKTGKNKGIGCVSRVLKNHVKVNFGLHDCEKLLKSKLQHIDVSHCKTITFDEFRNRILSDGSSLNNVIVGNELKNFVGIGWITIRVVTEEDLRWFPRVI